MERYEVYVARDESGVILYVGQGRVGRSGHCNSGTSHVYELNKMHFNGEPILVETVLSGISGEDAKQEEIKLIKDLEPRYNVVHTKGNYERRSKMANYSLLFNKYVRYRLTGCEFYQEETVATKTYDTTLAKYPLKLFMGGDGVLMSQKDRNYVLSYNKERNKKGKHKLLSEIFEPIGSNRLRIRRDFIDSFQEWLDLRKQA